MTPGLRRFRSGTRFAMVVVAAAALTCVLALAHRMRLAVDTSDEGFTLAMPYRYVLGDRPFVDEISFQQTPSLLLYPFIWLYVKLTGGSTGIVLYGRWLQLVVFKGAAALAVHRATRTWLRHRSSPIAVALAVVAFVPFSIPNAGYNIIGLSMLTAGAFLTAASVDEPVHRVRLWLLFLAGLAYGFMTVAYPPLGPAAGVATVLVFLLGPTHRFAATGTMAGGGVTAVLLVLPALRFGGIAGLQRSLHWNLGASQLAQVSAKVKVHQILESLWAASPSFIGYALAAVVVARVLRWRPLVAVVITGLTIAFGLCFRDESGTYGGAINTVAYAALFAPALLLLARPDTVLLRGAALVLVPSFVGGILSSYFSGNGVVSAYVGLFAAFVLFVALAVRALEEARADAVYCTLPALGLVLVLVTRYYDYVYRDAPVAQLTEVVRSGPWRGIKTTRDRVEMLDELTGIVERVDQPGGRILFLYESPGLYLASRMPPSAQCVWEVSFSSQEHLLAYWQKYPKGRGVVVYIKGSNHGAIDSIVAPLERRMFETRHFVVYRDHG